MFWEKLKRDEIDSSVASIIFIIIMVKNILLSAML